MYSFYNIYLTAEELYERVKQDEIIHAFHGDFVLGEFFPRYDNLQERTPSARFRYYDNRIYYMDSASSEKGKDPIDFVATYYLKGYPYAEVISTIYRKVIENRLAGVKPRKQEYVQPRSKSVQVSVSKLDKTFYDAFWKGTKLSPKTLMKHNVLLGHRVSFDNELWHIGTTDDPLYVYLEDEAAKRMQVYRPLAPDKRLKFRSHNGKDRVMSWEQFLKHPNNKFGLFTKSKKDIMTQDEVGIGSFAPFAEGHDVDEYFIREARKKVKYLATYMDPDEAGIKSRTFFLENYDIPWITTPSEWFAKGIKDSNDILIWKDHQFLHKFLNHALSRLFNL